MIKKVENIVPWTHFVSYLNAEQKTNQEKYEIERVIKKNCDKLYLKWKGYDNSFNSWIDK